MKFDEWFDRDKRMNVLSFQFAKYIIALISHTKWNYITPINIGNDELNVPHIFSVSDQRVREDDATYTIAVFPKPLTVLIRTKDIDRLKEIRSEEGIIKDRGEFVETINKLLSNVCTIKWQSHTGWDLDLIGLVNDPDHLFEDDESEKDKLQVHLGRESK